MQQFFLSSLKAAMGLHFQLSTGLSVTREYFGPFPALRHVCRALCKKPKYP